MWLGANIQSITDSLGLISLFPTGSEFQVEFTSPSSTASLKTSSDLKAGRRTTNVRDLMERLTPGNEGEQLDCLDDIALSRAVRSDQKRERPQQVDLDIFESLEISKMMHSDHL